MAAEADPADCGEQGAGGAAAAAAAPEADPWAFLALMMASNCSMLSSPAGTVGSSHGSNGLYCSSNRWHASFAAGSM